MATLHLHAAQHVIMYNELCYVTQSVHDGSAGAEGFTTNELKYAVEECRQSCVEKRAAAGNAGPKTYDGLRGDSVSFYDHFARVSDYV